MRQRLLRATAALEAARIPYAVVGGHAVAGWVSQVDEGAVRNTRDVDILIRRPDFPAVKSALEAAGFVYTELIGVDVFLDGPQGQPSQGVHLLYATETVRPDYSIPNPDVTESVPSTHFRIVDLEGLVRMKLVSNRDKDRTHIRDLIGVCLIDATWPDRFPPELADRLRAILANPDG
ncbi:MAG TPA: hypothetical protein VFG68_16380 [Fimbriiglobus sp.]|nr:hypothetical protein [Fimbriiglobus sp.]